MQQLSTWECKSCLQKNEDGARRCSSCSQSAHLVNPLYSYQAQQERENQIKQQKQQAEDERLAKFQQQQQEQAEPPALVFIPSESVDVSPLQPPKTIPAMNMQNSLQFAAVQGQPIDVASVPFDKLFQDESHQNVNQQIPQSVSQVPAFQMQQPIQQIPAQVQQPTQQIPAFQMQQPIQQVAQFAPTQQVPHFVSSQVSQQAPSQNIPTFAPQGQQNQPAQNGFAQLVQQEIKTQNMGPLFKCSYCPKEYSEPHLILHIEQVHGNQEGKCAICVSQPGGDPNFICQNLLGHMQLRHNTTINLPQGQSFAQAYSEQIPQLENMGFRLRDKQDQKYLHEILQASGGNIEIAIDKLINFKSVNPHFFQ